MNAVVDVVARWRGRAVAVERLPLDGRGRVRAGPFLVELDDGVVRVDGAPIAAPALVERADAPVSLALAFDTSAAAARDGVDVDPTLIRAAGLGLGAILTLVALFVVTAGNRDRELAYVLGGAWDARAPALGSPGRTVSFASATSASSSAPAASTLRTPVRAPDGMFAPIERAADDDNGTDEILEAIAKLAARERAGFAELRALVATASFVDGAVFHEPDHARFDPRPVAGSGGGGAGLGFVGVGGAGDVRPRIREFVVDEPDLELLGPRTKPEAAPIGYAIEGERERDCPDDDAIERAMRGLQGELRACYDRTSPLYDEHDLFAVGARWTILPDGRFVDVHAIELEGIDENDVDRYRTFTRCIERTLARGRADTDCPGKVEVHYPLFFAPGG